MNCFAYLRVSGPSQIDGDGFPRQEASIRAFCLKNDLELVGIYKEEGISGDVDGMDRPGWAEMLEDCAETGVDCVVVEGIDRLSRDSMVFQFILHDLKKKNIKILSAREESLGKSDPVSTLISTILAAFWCFEKQMLVSKLRVARDRKRAREGWCGGNRPYGLLAEERETVEFLRNLRESGLGWSEVAKQANLCGLVMRNGQPWSRRMAANAVKSMVNVTVTREAA